MTENQKLREALQAISHIDDTTNHSVDASAALDRIGQIARQALALPTKAYPVEGGEVPCFPINGKVWFRESTNEWVLELSGVINDTNFTVRHTCPPDTKPEDVVDLPNLYPPAIQEQAQQPIEGSLFCDMKTDADKANFFLSGRGYETGVIAKAIQNDVAMAYQRCANYAKQAQHPQAHDHLPDAGKMVVDHFPDATKMIETAVPVGEREAFEAWLGIKPCGAAHDFGWDAWQARAALSAGDAVYAQRYRWLADCLNYPEAVTLISDGSLTEDALGKAIDAAMRKGQL